ncbi:nucleobase:cation symporter-2 family protein [Amycolatopsis japonica]
MARREKFVRADSAVPIDERPAVPGLLFLALQHVLIMYASTVTVPVVIAAGLGLPASDLAHLISADLVLCGLGTLLQSFGIWKVGLGMPLVVGGAFTGVAPMIAIGKSQGVATMYGAVLLVGLITFICAPLAAYLVRLFPPLVLGTAIVLIGIQLLPAAFRMIVGSNPAAPGFATPRMLAIAGATGLGILLLFRFLPPRFRPVAMLGGLAIGAVTAAALGAMKWGPGSGAILELPEIWHFGAPRFGLTSTLSLLVIQAVLLVELCGQVKTIGSVVGRPVGRRELARAIRADGVVNIAGGGLLQSMMYVTFVQNIGLVTMTKVFSRYVTAVAGGILVFLGLLPAVGRGVAAVPGPVFGAAMLIMFGMIIALGVQLLGTSDLAKESNLLVAGTGIAVGLLAVVMPALVGHLPALVRPLAGSSALGIVVVVVMNLCFHGRADGPSQSERAAREGAT